MSTTLWERALSKAVPLRNGCVLWIAAKHRNGYGQIRIRTGKMGLAHRVVYELLVGPIPEGMVLDHLCRNRWCVSPAHLEPVTMRENLLRGDTTTARHASKTHCPQGHPYDEKNTLHYRGARFCRECNKAHCKKYQSKRKAR